jgi:hypothetical protein
MKSIKILIQEEVPILVVAPIPEAIHLLVEAQTLEVTPTLEATPTQVAILVQVETLTQVATLIVVAIHRQEETQILEEIRIQEEILTQEATATKTGQHRQSRCTRMSLNMFQQTTDTRANTLPRLEYALS